MTSLPSPTWTRPAAALAVLLPLVIACDGQPADLPGPTRGTWLLQEGMEGRRVIVSDTAVRIEVEGGAFGSAAMTFRTSDRNPRGDLVRVGYSSVTLEQFNRDSVVASVHLTRDSSVVRGPEGRRVYTASDSVLSEGGRLVLAPHADSSLDVGLPSSLLRGAPTADADSYGTVSWPDSAGALEGAEGWTVISYGAYRP